MSTFICFRCAASGPWEERVVIPTCTLPDCCASFVCKRCYYHPPVEELERRDPLGWIEPG